MEEEADTDEEEGTFYRYLIIYTLEIIAQNQFYFCKPHIIIYIYIYIYREIHIQVTQNSSSLICLLSLN